MLEKMGRKLTTMTSTTMVMKLLPCLLDVEKKVISSGLSFGLKLT